MDKIEKNPAPKDKNVVFVHNGLPEEVLAGMQKAFPNATFRRTDEATGDEAAQINATEPPEPNFEERTFSPLTGLVRECLLQCDATTNGGDQHTPVLKPNPNIEQTARKVAYAKLQDIASNYGLRFNEQEVAALFMLSAAFTPTAAINAAHEACRSFVGQWGV